jgi:hypothetical protein
MKDDGGKDEERRKEREEKWKAYVRAPTESVG